MRTTIDLPDDLFRQLKATTALQGRSLKDLVADGVRLILQKTAPAPARARHPVAFPLIRAKHPPRLSSPEELKQAFLDEETTCHARKAL